MNITEKISQALGLSDPEFEEKRENERFFLYCKGIAKITLHSNQIFAINDISRFGLNVAVGSQQLAMKVSEVEECEISFLDIKILISARLIHQRKTGWGFMFVSPTSDAKILIETIISGLELGRSLRQLDSRIVNNDFLKKGSYYLRGSQNSNLIVQTNRITGTPQSVEFSLGTSENSFIVKINKGGLKVADGENEDPVIALDRKIEIIRHTILAFLGLREPRLQKIFAPIINFLSENIKS